MRPRLGALNVRYVVVPGAGVSDRLDEALGQQVALEPRPVADGRVLRVNGWLPRAVVMDPDAAGVVERRDEVPEGASLEALEVTPDGYGGAVDAPGTLLVAEDAAQRWGAVAGGESVELEPAGDRAALRGTVTEAGDVRVEHTATVTRRFAVAWQVLAVLLTVSLALRPPGFARALREESP